MKNMSPYLAGLLFGDGTSYLGKNGVYAVWIDQHERNCKIIDRAVKEFKKMDLNVHHYGFLNKIRAMIYSKALFHEFRKIRENPIEFFRSLSKKQKLEFFSGFFDAEGTATDRLVVYNGNLDILNEILSFLFLFLFSFFYKTKMFYFLNKAIYFNNLICFPFTHIENV